MQTLEEIVYAAISHGKRKEFYEAVAKIRDNSDTPTDLSSIYQEAYDQVVTKAEKPL